MRSRTRTALYFVLAALPAPLLAQGVTVHSMVDTRLEGALGTVARFASHFGGQSMHDVPTTTYLSGHRLRTESGTTATIIDADAGRITTVDDKSRTYTSMTFDEMAAAMKKAQDDAKAQQAKAASKSGSSAKDPNAPKGDVNVTYKVTTDRPGQHQSIAGYDAERVFMTITMEGTVTPEGEQAQQAGSMVMLIDQWIAKSAPQSKAMAEFSRAYAAKAGRAFRSQMTGLQGLMASDARMKSGLDAAAKEMAKVQGTPLRSVVYLTIVPAGMQFDRQLALGDASASAAVAATEAKAPPEEKPKGLGGMFGRIKAAAAEASKKSDAPKADAPPRQSTLVTMTDEVKSITPGAVPASTFEPPAGYREVKPQQP